MQRSIINISMPAEMAKRAKRVAKEENKTQSELFREAFRRYESDREWAKIWKVGEATAKRMGIKTLEDIERIAG